VLIVEHGYGVWGAQLCLLRLAPLLEAHGVEQILAAPPDSALAAEWRATGRRHVVIEVAEDRDLRGPDGKGRVRRLLREVWRNALGAWRTARAARQVGADVLHANSHGWAYTEVVAAGWLARRPSVLHVHGEVERTPVGRIWRVATRFASAAVPVSGAVARTMAPRLRGNTHVVRNGIDPHTYSPGPADPLLRKELTDGTDAPVVLVLARLVPLKGIDHVIRAIAMLPPELGDVRLAVAGESADPVDLAYEAHLATLSRELLGDRARFLGRRTDVVELIRASDVVALASETEGFGLCLLEAQACGRPAVAYPAGGVTDVIEHEVDGLLAAQGDVADLSRQLARVLGDPAFSARLGAAARERVLRDGTLQRQADQQAEILRRLVAKK
jgi:glycosyltransferase involved in cell wall biosynthesis